ncbi:MAG: DUF58 domain-containing protein [Planctomycetota bacterium]|jgi:uncharacterized protein (DUF58 family)
MDDVQESDETSSLLEEEFLRRLEQLELTVRKATAGKLRGERRSRKRGIGVDFADYRNYVHGDDPRFIDWNIYGRLEKLFLKLYMEEEDLDLHILLDTSSSMEFGKHSKFLFARKIAAALAYVGLCGQNRVTIHPFSAAGGSSLGPIRGKRNIFRIFEHLEGLEVAGRTHLAAASRTWAVVAPRRGVAVLVSDFLDPGEGDLLGFEAALPYLAGRSLDVHAIHILSPEEVDPPFKGDVRLIDSETDLYTEISMGEPILKKYIRNLRGFLERIKSSCLKRGIPYLFTKSDASFERVVLDALRRGGLLR